MSNIFINGGGAGIGSYVVVFKNGVMDPTTNLRELRGAYDAGDSILFSIVEEGVSEALVPASGWVDEEAKLHLIARDFDDDKTYNIGLGLEAHEAEIEVKEGIDLGEGEVQEKLEQDSIEDGTLSLAIGFDEEGSLVKGVPPQGPQGPQGIQGETGPQGPQGPAGPGVASGGTTGQILAKASGSDYDTQWITMNADLMTPIAWADLKALRDNSELVPGMIYRITDYACTTTQADTSSAGHQFDILVIADTGNALNENARACLHNGDTYFANSRINAWRLQYCLDNDSDRFEWADTVNGKGVIYRMIDEFQNDVAYDFKNILFSVQDQYSNAYTFSRTVSSAFADASLIGYHISTGDGDPTIKCHDNTIHTLFDNNYGSSSTKIKKRQLNFCVFISSSDGATFSENIFYDGCHKNTCLAGTVTDNVFAKDCCSNVIKGSFTSNTLGRASMRNVFNANGTYGNYIKGSDNTFGESFQCNTMIQISRCRIGNSWLYNHFGIGSDLNAGNLNYVRNCQFDSWESNSSGLNLNNVSGTTDVRYYHISPVLGNGLSLTLARGRGYPTDIFRGSNGNLYERVFDGTQYVFTAL